MCISSWRARLRGAGLAIVAALALAPVGAAPAQATDWVIGLNATKFARAGAENTYGVELEVHGRPFWHLGPFEIGFAAAARADGRGNAWVGAGLAAITRGASPWFVEASLMPGHYSAGKARFGLGHRVEFRSLIGVGYRLDEATRVSVALSHVSNANLGNQNPGADSLSLRWRRSF